MAYAASSPAVPDWLNKGDNAWQLTAATFVGIQSMPGLVVLYGSIVKKKWAVNSAFMALYAYASSLLVWVLVGFRMAFGERLLPFWGKAGVALTQDYLVGRAKLSATERGSTPLVEPFYPEATLVLFQFEFAAITLILLAGSVLGRTGPVLGQGERGGCPGPLKSQGPLRGTWRPERKRNRSIH